MSPVLHSVRNRTGKPLTLAVEPVDGEDSKADAVERLLARVGLYPFDVAHLLMDRAAYVGEVIGVLRAVAPPVFPVKTGKRRCGRNSQLRRHTD